MGLLRAGGASFAAGVCSGAVAATVTTPADVLKTQMQVAINEDTARRTARMMVYHAEECGISRHAASVTSATTASSATTISSVRPTMEHAFEKPTMMGTARQVIQNRGMLGLFTGVVPRVAKVAPACGIMIASFEMGKKFFGEQRKKRADLLLLETGADA